MAHAVVIGAGIGGLTAALALARKDWSVTVLEQAASIEPVGAGLAVAPNALRALDVIGVGDEVRRLAAIQGQSGIRTPDGRWLSRTTAEAGAARYGDPIVLLARSALVGILAGRLPQGACG
ncbi:FAD-dependent oxidoreductase [Microbispora sp. GKU 823]|uniref:FAD-dependent oxidoreductase n=1 Tax=Microbispora sp. GKU 823 TaxID=1652100 RepID=UPI0021198F96|nr:FAD-dependent oxidoreductase [Microbispora sp. GKU 823]